MSIDPFPCGRSRAATVRSLAGSCSCGFRIQGRLPLVVFVMAYLVLAVGNAAAGEGRSPLPGDRAGLTVTPGWQAAWCVDEIRGPVRWIGNAAHLRVGVEIPVGTSVHRWSMDISHVPLELDGQGSATMVSPWAHTKNMDLYFFDMRLDSRWRAGSAFGAGVEAGTYLDWRVENIGNNSAWTGYAGYDGVFLGPFLRFSGRPVGGTDVSATVSTPLCGWMLRSPYLGYEREFEWQREVRFRTPADFRQVQAECAVRHALNRETAMEGAMGFDWSWTRINRPMRTAGLSLRVGLVIGM